MSLGKKFFTVRCTINVSELYTDINSIFETTFTLCEGLGYVHIGQVGWSELSAYNIILVLVINKLTRMFTKHSMMC